MLYLLCHVICCVLCYVVCYVVLYTVCYVIYCDVLNAVWCVALLLVRLLQVPVSQSALRNLVWRQFGQFGRPSPPAGLAPPPIAFPPFLMFFDSEWRSCYVMLCCVMLCCYGASFRLAGPVAGVGRAEQRCHAGAGVRCRFCRYCRRNCCTLSFLSSARHRSTIISVL